MIGFEKARSTATFLMLLLGTFGGTHTSAWGQKGLEVSIAMSQTEWKSGAPIWIRINYVNSGNEIVFIPNSTGPYASSGLSVKDANGDIIGNKTVVDHPAKLGRKAFGIQPGKKATESVNLLRMYNLDQPGTYSVHIEKEVGPAKIKVISNEVTFTILH